MKNLFVHVLLAVAVSVSASVLANSQVEAPSAIPVADFFLNEAFSQTVMSPSGRHVAAVVVGGPQKRRGLVVFDADDLGKSKAIAIFNNADVDTIQWVNDERLLYDTYDYRTTAADQRIGFMHAVDRQGAKESRRMPYRSLYANLNDGTNDAIFIRTVGNRWSKNRSSGLIRVDTLTTEEKNITFGGPDSVLYWALDWRGIPRAALAYVDGKARMHWRVKSDSPWTVAREWNTYANQHESPLPVAVDDQDRLYVIARDEVGGDENWLYRVDMRAAGAEWKPLISLKGYDFDGSIVWGETGRVLGFRHLTDAWSTTWVDPGMKAIQADVDKLLLGTANTISCGLCTHRRKILVNAWSDRDPGTSMLYDTEKRTLQGLGRSRPWIKPERMARREFLRFSARDGLSIPVHVTRPIGQNKPGPMVVLVHGGPFVRGGRWSWDAESQFLASRGYTVIEPEFRGSMGFGYKLFRAGWKQWGLAMQDDIADATLWAVMQGYADSKRVCIAGASYGGYAALMGLVKHDSLYQCAVSWAAVSDINLIYDARWSNLPEQFTEYGMPMLVADQSKDAAQIRETSPLQQASRIKKPVLLAHGGEDYRVPIYHATRMRDALQKHAAPVEWVSYADEGHGWLLEATQADFWTRVEGFLRKHTAVR